MNQKFKFICYPRGKYTQLSPIILSQVRLFSDENWPYCRLFTKRCSPYGRSQCTPLQLFSLESNKNLLTNQLFSCPPNSCNVHLGLRCMQKVPWNISDLFFQIPDKVTPKVLVSHHKLKLVRAFHCQYYIVALHPQLLVFFHHHQNGPLLNIFEVLRKWKRKQVIKMEFTCHSKHLGPEYV